MDQGQWVKAGDGSVIVQIQGDGSIVYVDHPHLELTRRMGLSARVGTDDQTGKAIETDLIRPFARAIGLVGREADLASLRCWLKSEPPISVRVLTGEAGLGKTRLALELAEEVAADGWRAGFLTRCELGRFLQQTNLAAWSWNASVLVIVDSASASASDLNAWFLQLVDHRIWNNARAQTDTIRPLRLLLLDRQATSGTGWWAETFRGGDGASPEEMLDPREPVTLSQIGEPRDRQEILKQTLTQLGSELTLPKDVDFESRLAGLTWGGIPLLLMVAAVTAVRQNFGAVLALASDELVLDIAKNELSRIRNVATGNRVDRVLTNLVDHVAAVATLRQGLARELAHDVIETEAAALGYRLPHGPEPLREALAVALPAANGDIAAVEPDMIGEAFLLEAWQAGSGAARTSTERRDAVLSAIRRAHRADPTPVMETIIRTCQDYVIHGHREPLGWLELVRQEREGTEALIELANAMPEATVELREHALEIMESARVLIKGLTRNNTEAVDNRVVYAQILNSLSTRLSGVGRQDEALEAGMESVALYREVSDARPGAFRHDLATSLHNLSAHLSEVGRQEEALDAARESLVFCRELADAQPDVFRHDLADSLSNLSNRLSEVGRREEALEAGMEAVALHRQLADARPRAFRHNLASSLHTLSGHLSGVGRREEALDAAREAVVLYRELAAERLDAFRHDLAMSLNNLSARLSEVGCREEALEAGKDSVAVYRGLAEARPDAFRHDLAASLHNLSAYLSEVGRREEALDAARESVAFRRELASERPDMFRRDLAMSLKNLSVYLSEVGRQEEALVAAHEAVALYRELGDAQPDLFKPELAGSVENLSNRLWKEGRYEEALAAAQESVSLYRELEDAWPDAFRHNLGSSLNSLSNQLSAVGSKEEALVAAHEAVALYRELASARPDAFQHNFATAIHNYSIRLLDLGRRGEALDAAQESVALYRDLANARPDVFRRELAISLTMLSILLSVDGRVEMALNTAESAVRALSEPFLEAPEALFPHMSQILDNYRKCCAEAGCEPNSDLTAPIVESARRLGIDWSGPDE